MKSLPNQFELGLCFIDLIGPIIAKNLVDYCGSAEAVFSENSRLLERIPGVGKRRIHALSREKVLDRARRELEFIEKYQIEVVPYWSERYPKRLLHCPDAPVMLFVKGSADFNALRSIAVVGTREPSGHGIRNTQELITAWRTYKPTIVSGLARGIDTIAHRSCVQLQLPTVGVLGHGMDRIYPPENRKLANDILQSGGAIITEFPSGTVPDAQNFPKRNRIVAGMTDATVVIEAARKGGALITGELASSYQRDVFALPGRISDSKSEGCLNLIKNNGAQIIASAHDIPESLGWTTSEKKEVVQVQMPIDLSTDEAQVVSTLNEGPKAIDQIGLDTGRPISQVFALLTTLELRGIIRSLPGKRYEMM